MRQSINISRRFLLPHQTRRPILNISHRYKLGPKVSNRRFSMIEKLVFWCLGDGRQHSVVVKALLLLDSTASDMIPGSLFTEKISMLMSLMSSAVG